MKIYNWEILPNQKKSFSGFDELNPLIWNLFRQLEIQNKKTAQSFLNPQLKNLISPCKLYNTQKAAIFLLDAIDKGKRIIIHGDFDIDGIVSTSILWDFLYRKLNARVLPLIPNRFDDGYGLSENTINKAKKQEADIIITVDCGIRDLDLIKQFPDIDFVITDHHSLPENNNDELLILKQKNVKAVVHPYYPKHPYPFSSIAGATVAWKLIKQIETLAKETHNIQLEHFDSNQYIGLVALATVGDIMPLIDENRIIVSQGLEYLKTTNNKIFKIICDETGIDQNKLSAYHFGFVIGPRLNAAGRMQDATDALRLLCTQKENEAREITKKLNNLNTQRQGLTTKLLKNAKDQIKISQQNQKVLIVHGEKWPEGIIGLIAGKLQEEYYLPTIVISTKQNIAKGSARSIKDYDITQALARCQHLLIKFGGHSMAAGFELSTNNLDQFIAFMQQDTKKNISDNMLTPTLQITKTLQLDNLNLDLVKTIDLFKPFGYKNPKPKFLFENLDILSKRNFGHNNEYTEFKVSNKEKTTIIKALAFKRFENIELLDTGSSIDLVATIELNTWKNQNQIQLHIVDFKIRNRI